MTLSDVEGQPRALSQLRVGLRSGRQHHAYLFIGPRGVGKALAAVRFAQALNCEADPDGCGACESCRSIERGSHPDVVRIQAEGADGGGGSREIRVQQIRELCASLQLRPVRARRKVAIILGASMMNSAGQNALLKTLEEPPPSTVLVLVADGDERLLSTVRSRCLRIPFGPLPRALLAERLMAEGLPEAEARLRAALPQGSGLSDAFMKRRGALWDRLQRLISARGEDAAILAALELAEDAGSDRERATEALRAIAWILRDLLLVGDGALPAEALLNVDLDPALRALGAGVDPAFLLRSLEAVREALSAIDGNGAPRLQLEAALLRLAGAA